MPLPRLPLARLLANALVVVGLLASLLQPAAAAPFTVLVLGDSLSSAFGLPPEQGWVSLLASRVEERGIEVVNHSISGETTAGGRRRAADAIASTGAQLVIIELGANDGLRGQPVEDMRDNLAAMIRQARDAGADVLLAGMRIPPNYGPAYTEAFENVYRDLATEHDIALVPFFLEPVAQDWDMMQADGIHPTAAAQPLLLDHLWPTLAPLLPRG